MLRSSEALREEATALADRVVERRAAEGIDVVRAPTPTAAEPERGGVAEATLRADEAFAALAFTDAARDLDAALDAADEEGVRERDEIVAVMLLRSMVHGAMGEDASADEAARDALAIDPALVVDPERYPPTLAARVEAARATLARCPITLVVDPDDATIAIDGASSPPPTELGCGMHWITVSRVGYARVTRRIELTPGAEPAAVAVSLAIDPAAALAEAGAPGTPVDPLVERGAAALGRTLVVLDLDVSEDGGILAALGARSVRASATATPDELASALLAPIDRGPDTTVVIGVGVGIGAAVAAAIAIALGVALAPSTPGWIGIGEVVRP